MSILNKRLPVQVFFQSANLSFRKVDNTFTVEFDNKVFKLTWDQACRLIDALENWADKSKEKYIRLACREYKQI